MTDSDAPAFGPPDDDRAPAPPRGPESSLVAILEESRALGFLGPGPVEGHLPHSLAFAAAVEDPPARAVDLGAGGGLPGLVLAALIWPDTHWVFVEAQQKRGVFLTEAVSDLGLEHRVDVLIERAEVVGRDEAHRGQYDLVVALDAGLSDGARVTVVRARAEEYGREDTHRATFDLVVARSFGRPAVVAECAAPLLRVGGSLVVSEPPAGSEGRWSAEGLTELGFGAVVPSVADGNHLVRCPLASPTPDRYPRRVGQPTKRPLF